MPKRASSFKGKGDATRKRDADRGRSNKPWRKWYGLARWEATRQAQFSVQPLCVMCLQEDETITPANVCDHVTPHRGDPALFWYGPFQSLCEHHHNSTKQREEAAQEPRIDINDVDALLD